jgi:hypothetical protein
MFGKQWHIGLMILMTAIVNIAKAEKIDLSPTQLLNTATHVIEGQVLAVFERSETHGDWKYTKYVAEVRVDQSDKGEGIKKGELIYVRYWQREWIGKGEVPPSTTGHRGVPEDRDTVRVYLARNAYDGFSNDNNDGGFNVIGANGFQKSNLNSSK